MKSRVRGLRHKGAAAALAAACLVASLLLTLAIGGAEKASSSIVYAAPAAPTKVRATVLPGNRGIRVSWHPSPTAHPAVTHYSVGAGRGTCPVTVSGKRRSAILPLTSRHRGLHPFVEAINAYGTSPAAQAPREISVRKLQKPRFRNVQILQFSDFHGAIENSSSQPGAARLATAFAADRKMSKATFTASSGDTIGGAPIISSHFRELPAIRAANGMGLDISTFGNHEHDRPLSHLREMISHSKFRWTVSNYSTRAPLKTKQGKVEPFEIIERGGVKVGFVGMNTEDTPTLVAPGNLDYGNAGKSIGISGRIDPVNAQIRAARKAGADVVVALLHQGWQLNEGGSAKGRLIDVSQDLRGADIAFGGHTHQSFRSIVGGMPVAEPKNSGHEYLRAELCLDTRKGKVVGSTIQPVDKETVAKLTPDPAVEKMVDYYAKKIIPVFDRKIGTVADLFPNGGNPAVNRTGETALGDLLADTLRAKYQTDLVFLNGGGIRDTLPASGYTPSDPALRRPGPGTTGPYDAALGDIKSILPFGNNAATSTMTGAQLWAALENGVSAYPTGRFPQISGFEFTFDLGQVPGDRITSVTTPNGTPIPADSTQYTVTTVDYMAFGGDGFGDLFNPARAEIHGPYDEELTAKLEADLALGQITPMGPLDGRSTCLGAACVPR